MKYMQKSQGEMSELAEGARLEIVYTPKAYLGFESPSLRQKLLRRFKRRFSLFGNEAIHRWLPTKCFT